MSSLLTAATLLTLNRALLALKLRPRTDAWRRTAQIMLGGEASTFILSAFALNLASDAPASTETHLARRLHDFLATEPLSYIRVTRTPELHALSRAAAPNYTLRIEPAPEGPARFAAPLNWQGDHRPSHHPAPGDVPLLEIVARLPSSTEADLWIRINHAALDGQPAQELLTRLQQQWGTNANLTFPTPDEFAPFTAPRPSPGRADLAECQLFLDFAPLLAWRRATNARLSAPMTTAAAILWQLARHEPFQNIHFGATAELPADTRPNRGVGVLTIRPNDHHRAADPFASYVNTFNAALAATRARTDSGSKILQAVAHLPPRRARTLLTHALENAPTAFGSAALTMLKDAQIFGAPIAETGHPFGFLAIGNLNLPTANPSTKVGSVTLKAPNNTIERTKQALIAAITTPHPTPDA